MGILGVPGRVQRAQDSSSVWPREMQVWATARRCVWGRGEGGRRGHLCSVGRDTHECLDLLRSGPFRAEGVGMEVEFSSGMPCPVGDPPCVEVPG